MTPEDKKFERIAQRHIADLKKSSKAIVEDAAVLAAHKVMAEFAQGAHTEAKVEYHTTMIQCPHCDGSVRVPAQPYPDNFIDALKYDVAKRDSEARLNLDPTPISGWGRQSIRLAIPEQPAQQEPVVWMYVNKSTHETKFQKHMRDFVDHSLWSEVPLYGEPLANHELQCVCGAVWLGDELVHLPDKRPPAQRKPLTDEELYKVFPAIATYTEANKTLYRSIARAIEAAHGIKGDA